MHARALDASSLRPLLPEFEAIPGVSHALLQGPPWVLFLICDHTVGNAARVELDARARLAEAGLTTSDVVVHLSFTAAPAPRQRVRFVGSSAEVLGPARTAANVALEWGGRTFGERVEGESGLAAELRLPALATVRALEAAAGAPLQLRLVGIRTVRVFDADLVVALLRSGPAPGVPLIGASLVSDELHRSAALAVLHATNRVLGNYLALED
jgi:hypothetical protein